MRLVSFERLGFGAGLRPSFCLRLGSGSGSLSILDLLDLLDLLDHLDLLDLFLGFWLVVVVRVYQHCFGLGPRRLRPLLQLLPLTEIPAAAAAADTFLDGGVVLSRVLCERDVVSADDVSLDLVPLAEDDLLADPAAVEGLPVGLVALRVAVRPLAVLADGADVVDLVAALLALVHALEAIV